MSTQIAIQLPTFGNQTFDHGVRHGISWHLTGDAEYRQPTAQLIVDFIRDNFLETQQEGYLDQDRLTDNAGFLSLLDHRRVRMQQAVNRTTEAFQRGLAMGKQGIFRGKLPVEPSEEGMVEIIQNLIDFALEGHLTPEQLHQDVGIVIGFISQNPTLFQ